MKRHLKRQLEEGEYRVDPDAVAFAILRRGIHFAPVPVMPSQVLVPADMFEESSPASEQLHVLACSDGA
jgi:hypothetical protein